MSIFHGAQNTNIYGGSFNVVSLHQGNKWEEELQDLESHTAVGAFHNSKERYDAPKCLPRTREAVLQRITQWIHTGNAEKPILWIYGPAGSGKSAIAQTVAEKFEEIGYQLAASFFFARLNAERNTAERLIPSIAYQLLSSFPATREFILGAIAANPQIFSLNIESQIKKLIIGPLRSAGIVRSGQQSSPIIIIDGLDECKSSAERIQFLEALVNVCSDGTFPFSVICASRPERDIRDAFNDTMVYPISDHLVLDNQFNPDADIERFFLHHFAELKRTHPLSAYIPDTWPEMSVVRTLVRKSSGHFIYASTVMKHLASKKHKPMKRLEDIMAAGVGSDASPFVELDALYRLVLSSVDNPADLVRLLGLVLFSEMDITPAYAEGVLGLEEGDIILLLDDLHSLMEVGGPADPLLPFHASFGDFLIDRSRAGIYYLDISEANGNLALGTFRVLFDGLQPTFEVSRFMKVDPSMLSSAHFAQAAPTYELLCFLKDFQWDQIPQKLTWSGRADPRRTSVQGAWPRYIGELFGFCRRVSTDSPAWGSIYSRLVLAFGKWFVSTLDGHHGRSQTELWTRRVYGRHLFPACTNFDPWNDLNSSAAPFFTSQSPHFDDIIYDVLRNPEAAGVYYIDPERHFHVLHEEIKGRLVMVEQDEKMKAGYRQYVGSKTISMPGPDMLERYHQRRKQCVLDVTILLELAESRHSSVDELLPRVQDVFITGQQGRDGAEQLERMVEKYRQKQHILESIQRAPSDKSLSDPFSLSVPISIMGSISEYDFQKMAERDRERNKAS